MSQRVRVEPFREAFEKSGMTAPQLAARLGRNRRDTSGIQRMLGLREERTGKVRSYLNYATAVKLCRALDLDPVDVGV